MSDSYNEIDCFGDINDDENLWNMLDHFVAEDDRTCDIHDSNVCKKCNSTNMLFDSNKSLYTCADCGIESNEVFESRPEWNNYEDGVQDTGRCGIATNPFLPKSSMGTIIGGSGYSRLRMIQGWNQMPYKERSLSDVLQHIEKNLKSYKITKAIIDNAKILYKNISEIKHTDGPNKGKTIIIRGLNRCGLIAACAFYGAKLQGTPRSTKEIADIFGIKLTQVTKGCRKFLELNNYKSTIYNLNSSHAQDFIERFGYKLKLKKNHIDIAIKIAENINKLDIASDHQPTSLAAGSISLVSSLYELNIPKKNISDIFGISEVTITKTFKKINPFRKIVIDDKKTEIVLKKLKEKMAKMSNDDIISKQKPVENSLNNIFIMPDDCDNEISNLSDDNSNVNSLSSLLNSDSPTKAINSTSLLNVLTGEEHTLNVDKVTLDMTVLNIKPKRGRGRPRKNVSQVNEFEQLSRSIDTINESVEI